MFDSGHSLFATYYNPPAKLPIRTVFICLSSSVSSVLSLLITPLWTSRPSAALGPRRRHLWAAVLGQRTRTST